MRAPCRTRSADDGFSIVHRGPPSAGMDRWPKSSHRHSLERPDAGLSRTYAAELIGLMPERLAWRAAAVLDAEKAIWRLQQKEADED